jgi:hypothetical protein
MRRLVGLLIALAALAGQPPRAAADCAPMGTAAEALPASEVAFVGEVTGVDGPVAQLAVREIWAGDLPSTVEVRGLNDAAGGEDVGWGPGMSEDDRTWTLGETYLVIPYVDGNVLRDSICSATTVWSPELEELRPADARAVSPGRAESTGPTVPAWLAIAGVAVVLVAGASVLAFRTGRPGATTA